MARVSFYIANICWIAMAFILLAAGCSFVMLSTGAANPVVFFGMLLTGLSLLPALYAMGAGAAAFTTFNPSLLLTYAFAWPHMMLNMYLQSAVARGSVSTSREIIKDPKYANFADTAQDWKLVVSAGHSLAERLVDNARSRMLGHTIKWVQAVGCCFAALVLVLVTVGNFGNAPGSFSFGIGRIFAVDPAQATVLPGGERTTFRLQFLARYRSEAGLPVAAWGNLVSAVRADYPRQGDQVDGWKTVQALNPAPVVTRPQKALKEHSAELGNGLIALPLRGSEATVIGWVDGRWGWVTVDRYGNCGVVFGPQISGCSRLSLTDQVVWNIQDFDPAGNKINNPVAGPAPKSGQDDLSFIR